jgi:hypothetical protein
MAYDNELMIAAPWKKEYGSRVFKTDAFISYRRSDATAVHALADLMRGAGAAIWLDEDDDLADRRLVEKVGHGIFHSRYIIVCVTSASTSSDWTEAEFGIALSLQEKWTFTRVLVARLDPYAPVPEELAKCRVFETSDSGASTLVEFVKRGNQFDFNPDESTRGFNTGFFESYIQPRSNEFDPTKISYVERLLQLPWRIKLRDPEEFDQAIQSFRNWLERADRSDLDAVPGLVSMLLEASFEMGSSRNKDNRANAVGAMTRLAQLAYPDAETQLLVLLSREENRGVISVAFPWIQQRFQTLKKLDRDIAVLAIVRAPLEAMGCFRDDFVSSLPESVHCKLRTGRDLDSNRLSRKERLRLATTRIDRLLKEPRSNLNYSCFQEEFTRLCQASLAFSKGEKCPKADSPELVSKALEVIERSTRSSEKQDGYPLSAIDLIFDNLLTPLAMCYADDCHADRARELFDYICRVLSGSGAQTKNKTTAYRVLLTALEQGSKFEDAEARVQEALSQAYDVDEKEARARKWGPPPAIG